MPRSSDLLIGEKRMSPSTLRMRKWRKKNREQSRETNRRWVRNNPEKANARYMRWLNKNREAEAIRNRASYPAYYEKNREMIKSKQRLSQHGVTQEWLDAKMKEQDNRCALCNQSFTETPHIDHSHACCRSRKNCGKCQRGLLCKDCNLGLGRFKDSIETLERAIQYLRRYNNGLESQS